MPWHSFNNITGYLGVKTQGELRESLRATSAEFVGFGPRIFIGGDPVAVNDIWTKSVSRQWHHFGDGAIFTSR